MALLVHAAWALVGCSSPPGAAPPPSCQVTNYRFSYSPRPKLDLLFTIDDSPAMAPVRDAWVRQIPRLVAALQNLPGGLPDLHLAVVSTSLASSRYPSLPGCERGGRGDEGGRFRHPSNCSALARGQNYLAVNPPDRNFSGELAAAVQCLADVGSDGCPFPQPLAATRLALEKAANPADPDNGGFQRPDAELAIVMVTNQDDCSVPADSDLFDPLQMTPADPLGAFTPYRCQEFGHRCNGAPPPHQVSSTTSLDGCVSAEDGRLIPVQEFITFLQGLTYDPYHVVVAALVGPSSPYVVGPNTLMLANGGTAQVPGVLPSCSSGPPGGAYSAQPAIRIKQALAAFGPNAALESICAEDFRPVLTPFTNRIGVGSPAMCIAGPVAVRGDGAPDCEVALVLGGVDPRAEVRVVPLCADEAADVSPDSPCWRMSSGATACPGGSRFQVCWGPACYPGDVPRAPAEITVQCVLSPHC